MKINLMYHPPTYLNKILIAGSTELELWNVKSWKLIHHFCEIKAPSPILTICEGPIVDVCALGCEKGEILIVNLLSDEIIMKLYQEHPVLSLTFSTDPDFSKQLLASSNGPEIIFWDLNESKTCSKLSSPHHNSTITKIQFLPGEPIIMSQSGDDNSLKLWLFDKAIGITTAPRWLKERSGHADPPHIIHFYGSSGN